MLRLFVGFFFGVSVAATYAQVIAHVDTNGVLKGFVVQDKNGKEVCRDPMVWLEFRGPESYIVCQ